MTLEPPRKLRHEDDRSAFHSGAAELDEWLTEYGWQNQQARNATTYVIVDGDRVAGYYAIAMGAAATSAAPEPLSRHRPTQSPCILLARLAVDADYAGRHLSRELLRDALVRSVLLSESIGAAAVLVHCRDEQARRFYLHNGDFLPSPVDDMHLLVPIKVLRRYVP